MKKLASVLPLFLMVAICFLASWVGETLLDRGQSVNVKNIRLAMVLIPLTAFLAGYFSFYWSHKLQRKPK
ncbi:hypothetical protein [Paenibacillus mendelii]|uniref:Uncharacterized protein n=1 Tax=Paenibacillus mendelii TaxID=206163 RepID=A0ABV6JF57_9BACL|nr:hypothetical protein [Paenibacillus mendelii]MCQ6557424.1 hypothetical protein [Paenibacillus mendelii]